MGGWTPASFIRTQWGLGACPPTPPAHRTAPPRLWGSASPTGLAIWGGNSVHAGGRGRPGGPPLLASPAQAPTSGLPGPTVPTAPCADASVVSAGGSSLRGPEVLLLGHPLSSPPLTGLSCDQDRPDLTPTFLVPQFPVQEVVLGGVPGRQGTLGEVDGVVLAHGGRGACWGGREERPGSVPSSLGRQQQVPTRGTAPRPAIDETSSLMLGSWATQVAWGCSSE